MKIGRNNPCPCGSGEKYKKCCGNPVGLAFDPKDVLLRPEILAVIERRKANEKIREQQQGLGRPIVSAKIQGQQVVCVGNSIYSSPTWKTFPDFLSYYIRKVLGADWGNTELEKPIHERHTILQWHDAWCLLQQKYLEKEEISSIPIMGVVKCYLGLAYSLYLMNHNVELQERLVKRLKNKTQFQGVYYELIVANALLRSGFDLQLEDETDVETKHCEFSAVSKKTGRKYWVEVKARGEAGVLGKTIKDGATSSKPLSSMIKQLNEAFKKPAHGDERLIFLDLNTEPCGDITPNWVEEAGRRLDRYEQSNKDGERELPDGESAYVLITNMSFHRELNCFPSHSIMAHGLGNDFLKAGPSRLSEIYRRKQRHIDVYNIIDALRKYPQIPSTFEGELPSESFGKEDKRILIGETYFFENIGESGLLGEVTSATVLEKEKQILICVWTEEGKSEILRKKISDEVLADYHAHPDVFFGKKQNVGKNNTDPYEFFEFLLSTYSKSSKDNLLEFLKEAPDLEMLRQMSQEDLAIEYCERWVSSQK